MSTAGFTPVSPIISSSFVQGAQYFQDRKSDLQQLGQALQSGDLAGAQQDFSAIQTLAQNGPFAGGNAFAVTARQQDFTAIGQALQSGDLAGAQQAFAQLQSTFTSTQPVLDPNPATPDPAESNPAVIVNISQAAASSTTASTPAPSDASTAAAGSAPGPEIVLNLGNSSGSSAEEITLSFNNTSSGEQLTIGVGSQQNPNAQQVTLNLPQNSNEQIVLNLLGNTSAPSSPSSPQTSGVNVVA